MHKPPERWLKCVAIEYLVQSKILLPHPRSQFALRLITPSARSTHPRPHRHALILLIIYKIIIVLLSRVRVGTPLVRPSSPPRSLDAPLCVEIRDNDATAQHEMYAVQVHASASGVLAPTSTRKVLPVSGFIIQQINILIQAPATDTRGHKLSGVVGAHIPAHNVYVDMSARNAPVRL